MQFAQRVRGQSSRQPKTELSYTGRSSLPVLPFMSRHLGSLVSESAAMMMADTERGNVGNSLPSLSGGYAGNDSLRTFFGSAAYTQKTAKLWGRTYNYVMLHFAIEKFSVL